jgi:hypothetical protein
LEASDISRVGKHETYYEPLIASLVTPLDKMLAHTCR